MGQAQEVNPREPDGGSREASDRRAAVSQGRRRGTRRLVKARTVPARGERAGSVGGGFMGAKPPKHQVSLALAAGRRGETPTAAAPGTEASMATLRPESPVSDERVMEARVSREHLKSARPRVQANHGSPGLDGLTVGA